MREALFGVSTGQTGVGKTYRTLQMIHQYIREKNKPGKRPRKVLIYDVNMEYNDFLAIDPKDIPRFTLCNRAEIRRVLPKNKDGSICNPDEMMELMNTILHSFGHGLLILEDINKYLIGTQTQEIIGVMTTNRHRDLDLMVHLQSLSAMTTRMWQNCSFIRFHRQRDDIHRYRERIPNFEMVKIAQILVNNQFSNGNKRFHCYIAADQGFIRGAFSNRSFKLACEEYAQKYPESLKLAMHQFSGSDKRQKALQLVTNDLYKEYNGNLTR